MARRNSAQTCTNAAARVISVIRKEWHLHNPCLAVAIMIAIYSYGIANPTIYRIT